MKDTFSLRKIFGELPVHPTIMEKWYKDNMKLFWLGKCEEESVCSNCCTIKPHIPRSHHTECFHYQDRDCYEVSQNPFPPCPNCGDEDGLSINSSRELGLSEIFCSECEFIYQDSCDEETLEERFREKYCEC